MLNEKQELEQYFKDEINRVSNMEMAQIQREISDMEEATLQELETELQRESGMVQEQEQKELQSDYAIKISKLHEDTNRKLMAKRRALSEIIFKQVKAKLKAYAKSDAYRKMLQAKAKSLAKHAYSDVTFYIGEDDKGYIAVIQQAYGKNCDIKIDHNIKIGGMRMECSQAGVVIDETFDAAVHEQNDWFYSNSGLFIK